MFTRKPRLQLEKFAINGAKRLFQQNLPQGDMHQRSGRRELSRALRHFIPMTMDCSLVSTPNCMWWNPVSCIQPMQSALV